MRVTPLLACALVLLAGCRDGGTEPAEARVASIRLSQTAAPVEEGTTLQITAELLDRRGRVLPAGSVSPVWSSSDESVATVADGLVTARHPGQARITATVRQVSATAEVTVHAVPAGLGVVSGAAQQGVAGMPAPQELAARVTDRNGDVVAGVAVAFVVVRGQGSVAPANARTDAQGIARATWTLGKWAGENVVEARVVGHSLAPAVFAATGRAGAPARLEKLSGDAQRGVVASPLPLPLVVRVVDANANPVPGAPVQWEASPGSGTIRSAATVTDTLGVARGAWVLGPGLGTQTVSVTAPGQTVSFSASASRAPEVTIIELASLPANNGSYATGINEAGQIVGGTYVPGLGVHASLWSNGVVTDLGTLGGSTSIAYWINDAGQIVGYGQTGTGEYHATLWKDGVITDLGAPGGTPSVAFAINAAGHVVGFTPQSTRIFLWKNGAFTFLPTVGGSVGMPLDINDAGQVVGQSRTRRGYTHATLWKDGVAIDLGTLDGEDSNSFAYAINEAGQVVGYGERRDGSHYAFLWENGVMTDLGTLGGSFSRALGINDAGHVVGVSETATGETHAFLRKDGLMIDLGTLNGGRSVANGINGSGWIVGYSLASRDVSRPVLWKIR